MGNEPRLGSKVFYKIGEVSQIAKLPAYVLRFWESEFPNLAPQKSKTGHRVYRKADVEMVLKIKTLLYDRGFTIAGARKQLAENQAKREELQRLLEALK